MFLAFGKQGQRLLPGGAVDAIARGLHHPLLQLIVGIGKRSKVAQRHKPVLYIFNPASTRPFFCGSAGGQERSESRSLPPAPVERWTSGSGCRPG